MGMRDFQNLKSADKPDLNPCNNSDNSFSGDYLESVVLESCAKKKDWQPDLDWHKIREPLTTDKHNLKTT